MARNPDMSRFLTRLPPELAASFTAAQLAAVELHFAMRHRATHTIDWRQHLRLGTLRAYVVVLAGPDQEE